MACASKDRYHTGEMANRYVVLFVFFLIKEWQRKLRQATEMCPGDLLSDSTQEKGTAELPNPAIMFPAVTGSDRSQR